MALDFPTNPTNGQLFNDYFWDAATGAWRGIGSANNLGVQVGQLRTASPIAVASQAARDALYPAPVQGNSVFRTDLGYTESYYGLYNVSTNPAGRTPAGWYKEAGQIVQVVYGNTISPVTNSTSTFVDTSLSATITPTSATSKIIIMVAQNGLFKSSGNSLNAVWLQLLRNSAVIEIFGYAIGLDYRADNAYLGGASSVVVDSPNTTSAVTYKTQFRNENPSSEISVQRSANGRSGIVLIEVAG